MNIFIQQVFAASSEIPENNSYSLIFMLLVFFLFFYFVLLRPQQKKAKAHKNLMDSISIGDEVIMTSGLVGYITKITPNEYVFLKINNQTEVIVKKDFILSSLPKGTLKNLI